MKTKAATWLDDVEPDDFKSGQSYLELLYPAKMAKELVRTLQSGPIEQFPAKDILRASELALIPAEDPDVEKQLKKMRKGKALSPLLLVRERGGRARLIVADGFHRLCAAVHLDESAPIPCKVA